MVWELALPGPRVVAIRERALRRAYLELKLDDGKGQTPDETSSNDEAASEASKYWSQDDHDDDCELPTGLKPNPGPPEISFVCRESFAVTLKYYKCVFSTSQSMPATYFDFSQDTLYLRPDTFPSETLTEGLEAMLEGLIKIQDNNNLHLVQNLALLLCDEDRNFDFEEWLADMLSHFRRVKTLILVLEDFSKANSTAPIIFTWPIDVGGARYAYNEFMVSCTAVYMPDEPENSHWDRADIDFDVLLDKVEDAIGEGYELPEIIETVALTIDDEEELNKLSQEAYETMKRRRERDMDDAANIRDHYEDLSRETRSASVVFSYTDVSNRQLDR